MTLLEMSLAGSILTLVLALVRFAAARRLPAGLLPVLWDIVLVRCLLPIRVPVPALFPAAPLEISREAEFGPLQTKIGLTMPSRLPETSVCAIFWIWAAGVLLCSLCFLVSYLRWRWKFSTAQPVQTPRINAWKNNHPLWRDYSIQKSPAISSPLCFGILHPTILLPASLDFDDEQTLKILPFVLEHEYVHICRFDPLTQLLTAFACCIHWFNPLIWLFAALSSQDRELSCDAAVVKRLGVRTNYARALLWMAEQSISPLHTGFAAHSLQERMDAIMSKKKASVFAVTLTVTLTVGLAAAFCLSPRETPNQAVLSVKNSIACDGKELSFTLPADASGWNIWIQGRVVADGMDGMSVHYLNGETWIPGETYSFPLTSGYDDLTMDIVQDEKETMLDLLPYLPEYLLAE